MKDPFVVCDHNVSPVSFCVLAEPHVDSAQQLTWQRSVPRPRTRIAWREEQCLTANYCRCSFPLTVLHWTFDSVTPHGIMPQQEKRKSKAKKNKRKRGKEHEMNPLHSLLTIISKIKKKPTCLYIEFFMCCLTTAILQSYTVFANVQFKMFVQKKEKGGKKKKGQ